MSRNLCESINETGYGDSIRIERKDYWGRLLSYEDMTVTKI